MVFNSLFNQPLMDKYTRKYNKELNLTHSKKEAVLKWIKMLQNNELKDEVSNYGLFSRIILENILGYNYYENIEENVKEDHGRGFSEFALKKDNKKFMVIELKGQDVDLDKPQNRVNDKRTPVDQAFDYAKHSGDIDWIVVSNYKEFRLYNWHKKQHQYISIEAEELQDPEKFKLFMLIFSKFSTVKHNLIEKLVSKTIFVERELEDEFYKLYNETRLMLIAELEHIHPELTRDKSVHYSQLILNRYIFICFAEDLGLLPEEISVKTIENPIKSRDVGHSEIWHKMNRLFIDINEGNEFKKIYGYNGGLFTEDLESLKIRDLVDNHNIFNDAYQKWKFEEYSLIVEEKLKPYGSKINPIYKNLMTISTFNFSTEVDVNILGHIFENSIGEIEELKADTKGRRKKEGIFYTPEYITDYICRNTIIPYLSKSGKANTVDKLIEEYYGLTELKKLDKKIEKIKIIDIACGSGAFLNKASDILLEIHEAIHDKLYVDDKTLMPFFDLIEERRKILLKNIYGVDLNEESVEITKLSLFLKVCKKKLKLPNLDDNIKCGNSLIDDPKFTDKPFNWNEEFKDIFKDGGFDIVISNPPYVFGGNKGISNNEKKYFKSEYYSGTGKINLFTIFIEKGILLLKEDGLMSYIIPNTLFRVTSYDKIREFLVKKTKIEEIIDLDVGVFEGVTASTVIISIKNKNTDLNNIIPIKKDLSTNLCNEVKQVDFDNKGFLFNIFCKPDERNIINKMKLNSALLGSLAKYIRFGVVITKNKDEVVGLKQINEDYKPFLEGNEIGKYLIKYSGRYLFYKKELLHRSRTPEIFESDKIMIQRITGGERPVKATFDNLQFYNKESIINLILNNDKIDYKYVLSLLNSHLINWYYNKEYSNESKLTVNLSKEYLSEIPVKNISKELQLPFIEKADKMLQLNTDLTDEISGFKDWLSRTYKIEKFSMKLDKYYKLSFDDFLNELKKKKVDIKPRKTQELLKKEFEDSLNKINPLLLEIEKTDNEIDQMVYELYGLSEDEIKIIEDSLGSN